MTPELQAEELTAYIRQVAPGYSVRWAPDMKIWPEDEPGVFEVLGPSGAVHYRRRSAASVKALAGVERRKRQETSS